jgi:hypothetical protein
MTQQDPTQQVQQQAAPPQQQPSMAQQAAAAQQLTPEQQAHLQQQDPLFILRRDLAQQRDRLRDYIKKRLQTGGISPNSELHTLYMEMEGTVLSFIEASIGEMQNARDHLFGLIVHNDTRYTDGFNQAFERLDDLEEPGTQFTPEDAAKFDFLCQAAKQLAEVSLDKPGNDKKMCERIIVAANECLEIIEQSTLDVDEDEAAAEQMQQQAAGQA